MLNERMVALGTQRSVIRELFEFGKIRAAEVGAENVFDFSGYNDIQKSIIIVLQKGGSLTPDEISALIGRDISSVLSELTELEMNGDIIKNPGQRYSV